MMFDIRMMQHLSKTSRGGKIRFCAHVVDGVSQLLEEDKHEDGVGGESDWVSASRARPKQQHRSSCVYSLHAGSHPLNRNLGPSFFRLSLIMPTNPWSDPARMFMTLLRTTSAGAEIVVATVPARADESMCKGMPSDIPAVVERKVLKTSYETS